VELAGSSERQLIWLLTLLALGLIVSGIAPYERGTWILEVAPIVVLMPILWFSRQRLPLTPLLYALIFVHAAIMMLGGHYTYARVPLGFWVRDALDLARNHYDRLGHFAQGFIPAVAAREILLRCTPLRRGGWLFLLVSACCLAVSACYEFVEWWAALLLGSGADAFLATQGDSWDTQWDMFLALIGSILGQLLLARWHDRQLLRIDARAGITFQYPLQA
jgi:putative membrane protein